LALAQPRAADSNVLVVVVSSFPNVQRR
jgi:hypothetical protein